MSGSLQREVQEFRAEVNTRLDDLEKSLERHDSGILAANIGATGIIRAQAEQEQQIRDLSARLRKLEHRKPRQ